MPTPRGVAQEENAIVLGEGGAKAKPKAAQKPAHPWQWYLTPAGIRNEARARVRQLQRIDMGFKPFAIPAPLMAPGSMYGANLYTNPRGQIATPPSQLDVLYGGVVKPIKTVANVNINLAQRAVQAGQGFNSGGFAGAVRGAMKPADPASSPVGRFVSQADRMAKGALGMQQDEQRRPEDLFWQQMGEMATTSAVGGVLAEGLIPAAAFTTGAFKALSPVAQQALRWTAGTGTESFISTALTDNRQGSVANAFGENAPLAVKPQDDMVSALGKSLIPNAGAEIAMGLGFLGATKAIGRGLEGFDNVRRRQAEGRAADEVANARNFTKEAGLQTEADGEHGFTEQAKQPTPAAPAEAAPAAAPAQAAPTEAAPVAPPPTQQQAEDALLGPKGQPAEEEVYSPELPEVDTAVMAADRLDDEQLRATAQGTGPVLPELERQLTEQRAGFQPQEGLTPEMVAAPTANLATPTVPWEDQWSQLPNQTLFSLASPANNPELFDIVSKMTGRSYGQFTWTDVVDGLKVLQEQGTTIIPSRATNSSGMSKTSDLSVNAPLLQYKDGVNAKGQQKGNSLEGVTKWNPEVEQTNLIWDNPADGKTYMVNGHNSLAKAQELGIPTIPTKRIFANTAGEARLIGAKANIASNGGTAFDAAKIIRELGIKDAAGLEAAGIPLESGLGASGLALSNLPDNLFQRAINGDLSMGRALTLGGSGLDAEGMTRVVQLAESREMTERGFAELAQMASSAPKVESGQMGLFGPEQIDTTVIKAELVGKVKAELTSNKNLMSRVGKSKSVQALAEKGGTQVNQAQVASAADITKAVLAEFDKTKYAAETPISTLLNQGAADIAAGAKPGVIAKRILQQLEMAAEAAPPVVKAPVEELAPAAPAEPGPMTPQERKQLKAQVVKRAIENGEVRPSATPLPDLPDPPKNLNDPAALLADEARLAQEYGTQDVIADQLAMDAKRQAMGWSDMSLDQKKANGMLDEWERPKDPVGDGLDERAAYAREQRMAAEASGDVTLAREWQNAERRLERERITQTQQRQATSQQDMFGVGQYDNSTPLLNGTPPAPEPGVKRFFHGSASEFKLVEGGEFNSGEMNIYGAGLYTTDSLGVAGKYQKKNKARGAQASGATYEVVEKRPIKFFDLDAPATPDVLNKLRRVAGYDSMTELVETAISELDGTPSLTKVFDEMRAYSRELDVPAYELQSTWHELSLVLEKDGYGGFTHQGGHLAGRGKELHQVRIYWDPANSVDIYRVDADGKRVAAGPKEGSAITPGFTAGDRAKAKGGVAITPAERLASLEERLAYAKKVNNTAVIEGIERVLPGLRKEAGVPEPIPAIDIPAGAFRKITAKTGEDRIRAAAESLLNWSTNPGSTPTMSLDQAMELVRAKGAILDPDAIPGLNMAKAREDRTIGRPSPEVQAAYQQFYGVKGKSDALSPLLDISQEKFVQGLNQMPINPNNADARQALENIARDAIRRITGKEDVAFYGQNMRGIVPPEHGGDGIRTGNIPGYYEPMTDIVNVLGVLENSPAKVMETVYHESLHRIQYTLLTLKDMEIFDSVFGKVRVNDLASMRNGSSKATIEKTSIAFQVYGAYKAETGGGNLFQDGVRTEVIKALDEAFPRVDGGSWAGTFKGEAAARIFQGFDKVLDLLERVNNGIRGRGFESVQSMFEKAYSGELAKTRAYDFAAGAFVQGTATPSQKARIAKLSEWKADNQKAVSEISQMAASIDEQINALKKQAMEGGC